MNNILFATDLSAEAGMAQRRAQQLAALLGAQLRMLHVPERADDRSHLASRSVDNPSTTGPLTQAEVVPGDPCEIIQKMAQDADLLVLGQPRRRTTGELFTGTTGERIIRQVTTPVLVVKANTAGAYRRMVVAVDLAHRPADILEVAKALADRNTQCDVIYAYASPQLNMMVHASTYTMGDLNQHIDEQRRKLNTQIKTEMTKVGLAGRASAIEIETSPAVTILAIAEQLGADLIILGSRRPGFKTRVLGSVATQILSRAKTDVLIVPPPIAH